jgi:ethanolamine utilization protein EutA (predicted chaperonin)
MSRPIVGQHFRLSWDGAKRLGACDLAGDMARVEAVGYDWVLVRIGDYTEQGTPLSCGYGPNEDIMQELEE